ncbi:MAG: hypothetical protein IJ688_06575 [Treponema sp.]|nr:hypothetical protein [Treponema sp.]
MNDLRLANTALTPEQAFPFQREIDTWNAEEAVRTLRPKVEQLKKVSLEVARELWIAHQSLTQRGGDRRSEDAQTFGFCDFLDLVGLSKKTAYLWLKLYDAANDKVRTPEELQLENAKSANPALPQHDSAFEDLIVKAMLTGVRGEGWTNEHERIYKIRKANERLAELARTWGKKKIRLNWGDDDYFAQTLLHNGRQYAKINLESKDQYEAQLNIFGALTDFLTSIQDPATRLAAVCNIGLRVRELVNDLADEEKKLNAFTGVEA